MRTLLALLTTCFTVAAQDGEFLYCKTVEQALTVIAAIDSELGYPNPATGTVTAVAPIIHKDGSCVIRLTISGIWSPRTKQHVLVAPKIQATVTPAQWGTKPATTTDTIDSKATIARIDEKKAEAMGYFTTATAAEGEPKP